MSFHCVSRNSWTNGPQAHQRRREWFTIGQAAMHIADCELVTMLLSIANPGTLSALMPANSTQNFQTA